MKEIWKDIVNYEGLYQISSMGRIKSFIGWNGRKYVKREKFLNPTRKIVSDNYSIFIVSITKNKSRRIYRVHRLVASAFIRNPNNKPQVNHIDSNPLNNKLENLEWVTAKENAEHACEFGNMKVRKNESEIIKDYKNLDIKVYEIYKKYNITKITLQNIKKKYNIRNIRKRGASKKYEIDMEKLLIDFKNGQTNKELVKKYSCSKDIIATRKYQFKKRGLL